MKAAYADSDGTHVDLGAFDAVGDPVCQWRIHQPTIADASTTSFSVTFEVVPG